jgi:hypothetical protein
LLAAAHETGLIQQLMAAMPVGQPGSRLAQSQADSRRQLLLTLLFLGAVGLARPWELRSYSGDGLALLTGRRWAYGYVHTDRFLAELGRAGADQPLTTAVAQWSHHLWGQQGSYYIDLHRKPVYSDQALPRSLIGRTGKILGCRAIGLLHDEQGHPLLALTDRGDTHLTQQLPDLVKRYQQCLGHQPIEQIIVDREGLGADFLAQLKDDFQMMTLLRSNQYTDLTSFTDVGEFIPLRRDKQSRVVCEVAPARFSLTCSEAAGEQLPLDVALIRDWRRTVPVELKEEEVEEPWPIIDDGAAWWEETWQPTPLPATPTAPKLIPIVSTAPIADVVDCVQRYQHRWPAQENIIRDFLLPLGLDHNHGYHKQPVENSEISKQRQTLKQQLDNVLCWRIKACQRCDRAGRSYDRRYAQAKARGRALYDELNTDQFELGYFDLPPDLVKQHLDAKRGHIEAELAQLWQGVDKAYAQSNREDDKVRRYALKARQLLRRLEDLDAQARQMFELDNRQDQIMTSLRLALANLVMWVRDNYFPKDYAHATWKRLAPFLRLPGHIVRYSDRCLVFLRPFNDQQLNRDLDVLCDRLNQAQLRLPDGRFLEFLRYTSLTLISDAPT